MRKSHQVLTRVLAVATLAWACGDSTGPVLELVQNGGFETGDFTGWTVSDAGNGNFIVAEDTTTLQSATAMPAPPESTFAAVTDQGGPGTHILYQDIALPAGKHALFRATVYAVSLAAWALGDSLDYNGTANQQFRVDIMDPTAGVRNVGAGVLMPVYQTMPGDTVITGYLSLQADLTPFAGQTVRIRFAEVDNQDFLNAAVDSVSVTAR